MMDEFKSSQRAGSHSTQIVHVGLTAAEANDIITTRIAHEFGELQADAQLRVESQLTRFKESLVAALVGENLLDVVANPNFWKAMQGAAVEAAGADEERDIDLLVDLLVERAKVPGDRRRKATIDAASQAIALLDEETLTGLTGLYAALAFHPSTNRPSTLFGIRAILLNKIAPQGLPNPHAGWVEHGVTLGAVRPVPKLLPMWDIQLQAIASYLSPGIPDEGAAYDDALRLAHEVGHPGLAMGHPYKEGFSMSRWPSSETLSTYLTVDRGMTQPDADALSMRMTKAWHIGEIDRQVFAQIKADYEYHVRLVEFAEWLSNLRPQVTLTGVGEVIARANLKNVAPQYFSNALFIGGPVTPDI